MDTAHFWCGCNKGFEGEPPEKCLLHGDTLKEVVKAPPPPKPKPKTKASNR